MFCDEFLWVHFYVLSVRFAFYGFCSISISAARIVQSFCSGYGNCWNALANISFMKIALAYNEMCWIQNRKRDIQLKSYFEYFFRKLPQLNLIQRLVTAPQDIYSILKNSVGGIEQNQGDEGGSNFPDTIYGPKFHSPQTNT